MVMRRGVGDMSRELYPKKLRVLISNRLAAQEGVRRASIFSGA